MTHDVVQHTRKLNELLETETAFVTVTLLDIRGSAPQIAGAKAIITHAGLEAGTIGGGKIEAVAIDHAQSLLADDSGVGVEFAVWNLQTDVGMTCGGEVKLFFEVHRNSDWPIAVFGAGHIAQSLIPLLLKLNCRVSCFDTRSDWLSRLPDHPKLKKTCIDPPCDVVNELDAKTFFVLMSKGHATDLPVLAEILRTREAPYVGVIGSVQKASVLRRDLQAQGIPADRIESFACPIGLPLGNNTPAEISISVVAQLIQRRDELGILKHKPKRF